MEFQEERLRHQNASEAAHKAAYEKFSTEAKKADRELAEIATHDELTMREKFDKIQNILSGLPKEVRHEIESALFKK